MRWLTVTVAGSSCCWGVLMAGVLVMPSPAGAPTIEVTTRSTLLAAKCNRTVALVDLVTDRGGPVVDVGGPNANRTIALVEIVTDSNQSEPETNRTLGLVEVVT